MRKRARWALLILLLVTLPIAGYSLYSWITCRFAVVVPGKIYRSAQPSHDQLAGMIRKYGIKTVLNLRGEADGATESERVTAASLGANLIAIKTSAREAPSRSTLAELIRTIESAPKPILIHCLCGTERTGTVSAMAAMALADEPFEKAESRAFVLPLPWERSHSGVSDVLEDYESYCDRQGVAYGGWSQFRKWALEIYRPAFYDVEIVAPADITVLPRASAEVAVEVTNRSPESIPGGDRARKIGLVAYTEGPTCLKAVSKLLEGRTPLPAAEIRPGARVSLRHRLIAPAAPGDYSIYFDLDDAAMSSFSAQGSSPRACTLHVTPAATSVALYTGPTR